MCLKLEKRKSCFNAQQWRSVPTPYIYKPQPWQCSMVFHCSLVTGAKVIPGLSPTAPLHFNPKWCSWTAETTDDQEKKMELLWKKKNPPTVSLVALAALRRSQYEQLPLFPIGTNCETTRIPPRNRTGQNLSGLMATSHDTPSWPYNWWRVGVDEIIGNGFSRTGWCFGSFHGSIMQLPSYKQHMETSRRPCLLPMGCIYAGVRLRTAIDWLATWNKGRKKESIWVQSRAKTWCAPIWRNKQQNKEETSRSTKKRTSV